MMDSLLNSNNAAANLTFAGMIAVIGAALILGIFISLIYIFTHRKEEYAGSFTVSLIMLPAIIAMIILLVGNNVATAFSLAGAFSLIRFRSAPGDPKDIAYVFFTLGVGLACGMGYILYAVLFAVILCGVMMILTALRFGNCQHDLMRLKIVLPEDMDYQGLFDDTLEEYTTMYKLVKVRTMEFGSLLELTFDLAMKDMLQGKAFLDRLRCKNGNLSIVLAVKEMYDTLQG